MNDTDADNELDELDANNRDELDDEEDNGAYIALCSADVA